MAFFDTIYTLPVKYSYADWVKWHDDTKPIRGRSPEIRPLGARRHCDQYSIRMREDKAVELVLYRTPVVTWHPDESVSINFATWASTMTCHFISRLVPAVRGASNRKEGLALWLDNNEVRVMKRGDTLVFDWSNGKMVPREEAKPRYRLGIDRKQANIVRREYADFIGFTKSMVSILRDLDGRAVTEVSDRFFMDNGCVMYGHRASAWVLTVTPKEQATHYCLPERRSAEVLFNEEFLQLVKSEDASDRTKAVARLFLNSSTARSYQYTHSAKELGTENTETTRVNMDRVLLILDEAIMRANAMRVLVRKQVRPDQLTGTKYTDWIAKEMIDSLPIK